MARTAKRLRWAAEAAALTAVYALVRVLPERWWRGLGRGLGERLVGRSGLRRDVIDTNLRHAFPEHSDAERASLLRRSSRRLGETTLEFFALGGWSRDELRRRVVVEGEEHLQGLIDAGRGAILTTGHYGNWELYGATMAARGLPMHVVARTQSNPWADALQNRVRSRAGLRVIKADASVRHVLRAVRDGEFVAMLPDVNAGAEGVFVDFLNRPASTPRGVAYFAWKLGCPLLPGFITPREDGTHVGRILAPIEPNTSLDADAGVLDLTQRFADALAAQIRAEPEHYFWVHRRWKTQPPARGAQVDERVDERVEGS